MRQSSELYKSRPISNFTSLRERMVEYQLANRGITDPQVLAAMREVPREAFVPVDLTTYAYDDGPLPIGDGQTISQPYIVALMIQALALKEGDRVLDIGTGSGYAAAILSYIAAEVYTVERLASLVDYARDRFDQLHYSNIHLLHGDGSAGWPEHAPFDAILVSAGGPEVPPILRNQLAPHGRLVMPVGTGLRNQSLIREVRLGDGHFEHEYLTVVRFVPLIGEHGWPDDQV